VADISFLEQMFQARQDGNVRYLADLAGVEFAAMKNEMTDEELSRGTGGY